MCFKTQNAANGPQPSHTSSSLPRRHARKCHRHLPRLRFPGARTKSLARNAETSFDRQCYPGRVRLEGFCLLFSGKVHCQECRLSDIFAGLFFARRTSCGPGSANRGRQPTHRSHPTQANLSDILHPRAHPCEHAWAAWQMVESGRFSSSAASPAACAVLDDASRASLLSQETTTCGKPSAVFCNSGPTRPDTPRVTASSHAVAGAPSASNERLPPRAAVRAVEMDKHRTRLHSFNQGGVISTDFPPFASTPALESGILHLAHTVWVQEDAKMRCSEVATEQSSFLTSPKFERDVDFLTRSESPLLVKSSIVSFDFKRSSHLRNLRNLRCKNTNRF